MAGQAASASSDFQPGSFDQFTGSKRAVECRGLAVGAAKFRSRPSSASSTTQIGFAQTYSFNAVRPMASGHRSARQFLMPAWSRMKAYCSAYSR